MSAPAQGTVTFSAAAQGNGTTTYHVSGKQHPYFTVHIEDTPGAAGDNTYTVWASNDDDFTVGDVTDFINVTNAWFGAASFTTDAFLVSSVPRIVRWVRIQVVRANNGAGADDGAWTIRVRQSQ